MDSLKRLKIAAQHMNTSLREVLPYGEGIMGYFYRHFLPSVQFCLSFIFSFSLGFGALWVPLGSLLGLLAVLLGGLWTQKC